MFSRTGNETFEPLSSLGTFRQYDGGSAGSYYNVINIHAEKDAKGSIYVGLMKEKVTTRVITNAKNKMLKHYKDADPDTAVLISASYLGFMKPSEFDPNWLGELLE